MSSDKITVEFRLDQLDAMISAVGRAADQDAEDIEILSKMQKPDREIIAELAKSQKRLYTLMAWLQHIQEEAGE